MSLFCFETRGMQWSEDNLKKPVDHVCAGFCYQVFKHGNQYLDPLKTHRPQNTIFQVVTFAPLISSLHQEKQPKLLIKIVFNVCAP